MDKIFNAFKKANRRIKQSSAAEFLDGATRYMGPLGGGFPLDGIKDTVVTGLLSPFEDDFNKKWKEYAIELGVSEDDLIDASESIYGDARGFALISHKPLGKKKIENMVSDKGIINFISTADKEAKDVYGVQNYISIGMVGA